MKKSGKWRAIFTLEDVKKFQKTTIYIVTHQLKKKKICVKHMGREKLFSQNIKWDISKSKLCNILS